MPRVTVILSSLNHGQFIAEAIQSVLDQTYTDFELFIIDDCSEDNSWEVIQSFRDPRIEAIRNPVRMRGVYGFNKIIRERAKGEFIAIHHSDDLFHSEKLGRQVRSLDEHPDIAATFTQVQLIDEDGECFVDRDHRYFDVFGHVNRSRYEWLNQFFFRGNSLCHPSLMIRRHCFDEIGYYDRRLGQLPDFDLWVRLCMKYEIYILDQPLTLFRLRHNEANQSGNKPETRIRIAMEYQQVLRTFLEIPSEQMLTKIFPEIREMMSPGDNVIPFLVSMCAARQESPMYQAFGINTLYELMRDPLLARQIEEQHGFGYPDLIQFVAEKDICGMRYDVPLDQAAKMLEKEMERIKSTVSWRVTKPLRLIANLPHLVEDWVKSR